MAAQINYSQADYMDVPFTPSPSAKAREAQLSKLAMANAPADVSNPNFLARATLFGIVGAAVGAVIYAMFIGLTGVTIGYLAILVGFLIGKAMSFGSNKHGGAEYQLVAVILTYLAIAAGESMLLWWFIRLDGRWVFNVHAVFALTKLGLMFPILNFARSTRSGVIGLLVAFVGIRAAWRMTSSKPGAARHPFKT